MDLFVEIKAIGLGRRRQFDGGQRCKIPISRGCAGIGPPVRHPDLYMEARKVVAKRL